MVSLFGSSGFIGSNLIKLFPNDFYCELRENNIPKYDTIVYAIGSNTNYNMFDSLTKDIEDNLIKLNLVLENCKGRDINLIFLSSWFVYGKVNGSIPVKETDCGEIRGYYSICKRAAEQMIATFCEVYNKKYKILRLANIYGPGDVFSKKKNALQYLINEIKNNRDIDLYYGGKFTRDFLHVDDCCRAIKFLIDNGDETVYNVCSGNSPFITDILDHVRSFCGSKSKFITCEAPKFHQIVQTKDISMDRSKLNNLGHYPKVVLLDGVKSI